MHSLLAHNVGKVHWHIISEQNWWDCPGATLFSSFVHIYVSPAKRSVASDAGAEQEQGEQNDTGLDNGLKSILKEKTILTACLWSASYTLVTQPMKQHRPNPTELRSMDSYIQILCRFQKCKRKVPPPSLLSNDFEKCWFFCLFLLV